MAGAALTLTDVQFSVRATPLLNAVSASFPRGACTVILGPNGAGKSLLMKIAHGLLDAQGGTIRWGRDGDRPLRHAMVAQRPLMMRRTTRANLIHALALAGVGYRARRAQAQAALAQFRLDHLADRPATRLSGGEQQRVAIARAAAIGADVIFLDEPTAALDPAATRAIEEMVQDLRAAGTTIIMTTHALSQARRLADHVLLLHHGRVVESGPAPAFFASPATAAARTFLAGDLLL